jgi:hypothetical protein
MTPLGPPSGEQQRWGLVTFAGGDRRWNWASRRLARQAQESGMFAAIDVFSAERLATQHPAFYSQHVAPWSHLRGFGLWVWKPFVIGQMLRSHSRELDGVMYMDAGSELNLRSEEPRRRLLEYWTQVIEGQGLLAPRLSAHPERCWTRRAVLDILDPAGLHRETDQLQASPMIRVDATSTSLVDEWLTLCVRDDHFLVQDPLPDEPLDPRFVAHRHDQSVFSVLAKTSGFQGSPDETYHAPDWSTDGAAYPIWAARNPSNVSLADGRLLGRMQRSFERLRSKIPPGASDA